MTDKHSADKGIVPAEAAKAPLRASLFAHLERGKLIRPQGGRDAVTPKIGEPTSGWGSS